MAHVHPFRALRPTPEHASDVSCPPYDVIDTAEARSLAQGRPASFLHVIRPEIDLPESTDEHADEVYERGAANLRACAASEAWIEDDAPALWVYRMTWRGRSQTGVYACVTVDDYDGGVILRHEETRVDKEDDRTRHILTQRAHAEPVMLTYRDSDALARLTGAVLDTAPMYDVTADDVRHELWRVDDANAWVRSFADVDRLYVADGHHRCKAASRAAAELLPESPDDTPESSAEARRFPAVLLPMSEMRILPYHRVVLRSEMSDADLLAALEARIPVTPGATPQPTEAGHVSMYLGSTWFDLALPPASGDAVAASLDVARLGEHVLLPLFDVTDPRTDPRLKFVGGIRGTGELERLVDNGVGQVAFAMVATPIEALLDVSDAGELMPPKSTWFEPKLRSGLLVHRF